MRNFIKFGLAKLGSVFLVIEALFLIDILITILVWPKIYLGSWIGLVLLTLLNIVLIIEWYGERRIR